MSNKCFICGEKTLESKPEGFVSFETIDEGEVYIRESEIIITERNRHHDGEKWRDSMFIVVKNSEKPIHVYCNGRW